MGSLETRWKEYSFQQDHKSQDIWPNLAVSVLLPTLLESVFSLAVDPSCEVITAADWSREKAELSLQGKTLVRLCLHNLKSGQTRLIDTSSMFCSYFNDLMMRSSGSGHVLDKGSTCCTMADLCSVLPCHEKLNITWGESLISLSQWNYFPLQIMDLKLNKKRNTCSVK